MPATTRPGLLRRRLEAARAGGDEGVALLLVLMCMLIATSLSMLLLGVVIAQVEPLQVQQKSTRTINGAQAGIDATLSQIRSAVSAANAEGKVFGDRGELPCTVTGAVGADPGDLGYTVTVSYYDVDPTDLTTAQRVPHALVCTPGSGTAVVPAFALMTSTSTAAASIGVPAATAKRAVQALYAFKVTNENIPGGLFSSVNSLYCLQAEARTVGARVKYVAAADCHGGDPLQTWVYDDDYAIKLADTLTSQPLCLTNPSATAGGTITLTACVLKQPNQLWSYEGGAQFRAQNATNTDYGSTCLWAGTKTSSLTGSWLQAGATGCSSSNSEWGSFSPEPKVGAGAASKQTNQIVNYLEFGRCMDVTNGNASSSYMIVYPCKQDPSGGTKLNWNHKWYYTEPTDEVGSTGVQSISIKVNNSATWCLQTAPAGSTTGYVTFTSTCNAGDPRQQFVRTAKVVGDYAASYTFKDSAGRCLSLGPKQVPASNGVKWSTIVAIACTGGSEQKWNAPAGVSDAAVSGTRETTYDRP